MESEFEYLVYDENDNLIGIFISSPDLVEEAFKAYQASNGGAYYSN